MTASQHKAAAPWTLAALQILVQTCSSTLLLPMLCWEVRASRSTRALLALAPAPKPLKERWHLSSATSKGLRARGEPGRSDRLPSS